MVYMLPICSAQDKPGAYLVRRFQRWKGPWTELRCQREMPKPPPIIPHALRVADATQTATPGVGIHGIR